ncbi:MAG: pyridoxamine 5'-phosphate oxidase [Winogradskyella sp.]|uniref:pyridoxamine 5'-phosphate oxidase n=1 Tax=Winogradskyella sp. TaxID=1883156 RepID=UPI001806FC88|nr:pyridoxamine 5'-phosphate oxidase [Winogradskyella sp.]
MEKDLGDYRKSYEKGELLLDNVPPHPMTLFENWFVEVDTHFNVDEANAMTLSTFGLDGFPKSRVVLLKQYSEEGFVFYTNYTSEKGEAISNNPNVCLSFFWHSAERQVIIKGKATTVPESVSDDYFNSRPRGSQLGAIVSNQSEVLEDRAILDAKLKALENEYEGKPIERPHYWGGYSVEPVEIEFWQGRPNRLHDRVRYKLSKHKVWTIERLSP